LAVRQRFRFAAGLSVLFAALAAGCNADAPTGADLAAEPGLDAAETADTAAAAIMPDFAVSASLTNQPSGFSPIAEWAATSMMPMSTGATSGYGVISGKWYRWYNSNGTGSHSDGAAPKSSSGTLRFRLPAGMKPGSSYGMISGWSTTSGAEYAKVYESGWIKIPSSNFEVHGPSAGVKMLGFWAVGAKGTAGNQLFGWARGIGTNPVTKFTMELRQQNIVTRNLVPNVDTRALFTAGPWHRYEILMEINSIGSANGKFQMWWNGIKTHNYTNVVYRTSAYPAKFFGRKLDPIWGGAGGSNKSREDRILFDHLYMSGVK
jgi:hypothetical protein